MKLLLRREKRQPSQACTLGFLLLPEKKLALVTLERPWIPAAAPALDLGGMKDKSCVPLGLYRLERHDSPKHPRTWALVNFDLDVVHHAGDDHDSDEDREEDLIHSANYVDQLLGCIAVGTRTELAPPERGGYCVRDSRIAMDKLRAALPWTNDHSIEILEAT